ALGDSLTAPYTGTTYGAGNLNWVEQLRANDGLRVDIRDLAVPGATSGDIHTDGQLTAAVDLIRQHQVGYAVLIVGANDVAAHLGDFLASNPGAFVTDAVTNVETALGTLAAAGHVRLAVGNIRDVTLTPSFQAGVAPLGPATAAALSAEISG